MAEMLQHTVKSYDEELKKLAAGYRQHGRAGRDASCRTRSRRWSAATPISATRSCRTMPGSTSWSSRSSAQVVRLLALRQPMASDLREIVAALKISSDLERIGDYAANIGKRVVALSQMPPFRLPAALPRMGWLAQQNHPRCARRLCRARCRQGLPRLAGATRKLDETYSSLFRELLTHMMEDPRNIGACTHLLFIAKNIERIGDHATNIAETVYYMVVGRAAAKRPAQGRQHQLYDGPAALNIHPLPLRSAGEQSGPGSSAPDIEGVLRGAYIIR